MSTPSAAASSAADLISGLGDDVLVRILELLPDAGDAVRTGALSRRWRGLWTRLPALRFASTSRPVFSGDTGGAEQFASLVDSAIALRAAATDPAIQHLAISFVPPPPPPHKLLPRSVVSVLAKAAQRWIRVAVQQDVKSFTLELGHAGGREGDDDRGNDEPLEVTTILDDLPAWSSVKMESMSLALGGARVGLPAAARAPAFASLSDLTLESMEFAVDSEHLLTRLLSSACCPRLQKLRLRDLTFLTSNRSLQMELLIDSEALLELWWEITWMRLEILRLRTPRLRVLRTVDCDLDELVITAPKLEELLFLGCGQPARITGIDDGGLPCVKSLRVELTSHPLHFYSDEEYDEVNGATFRLLSCCTAVACLEVCLYVLEKKYRSVHVIEGRIPWLPQVTSLTVHVQLLELHSFGSGMGADILA